MSFRRTNSVKATPKTLANPSITFPVEAAELGYAEKQLTASGRRTPHEIEFRSVTPCEREIERVFGR